MNAPRRRFIDLLTNGRCGVVHSLTPYKDHACRVAVGKGKCAFAVAFDMHGLISDVSMFNLRNGSFRKILRLSEAPRHRNEKSDHEESELHGTLTNRSAEFSAARTFGRTPFQRDTRR